MTGSFLLSSTSIVKLIAVCTSFNVAKKAVAFGIINYLLPRLRCHPRIFYKK